MAPDEEDQVPQALAGNVSRAEEHAAPEHRPRVRGPRKLSVVERRGARRDRRDVPDAWHEITKCQQPDAETLEPPLRPLERSLSNMQHATQRREPDRSAQHVAP